MHIKAFCSSRIVCQNPRAHPPVPTKSLRPQHFQSIQAPPELRLLLDMEESDTAMLKALDMAGPGELERILKPLYTTNASMLAYGVTLLPREHSKYLDLTFSIMVQVSSDTGVVEVEAKPIIMVSPYLWIVLHGHTTPQVGQLWSLLLEKNLTAKPSRRSTNQRQC